MKVKTTVKTVRRLRQWLVGATLVMGALALAPQVVLAWPSKYTSCSSCHTSIEPTATVSTALNGVAGTTISVAPGTTFEIDYIVRNISGSGVLGMEIAVPTGWTVASGTANAPALAGWNTVWDLTDNKGWATANGYSTATQFGASPQGYTINFDATGWDTGTRNAAYDNASAGDLDGVANTMGTDARITVPAGATNGSYTIQVIGVGHTTGGSKGYVTQAVTVNVSGGDSTPPTAGPVTASPQSATFVPAAFTVTTSFTDAESTVTSCQYTLNGVAWSAGTVSGTGPYTCTANIAGQTSGSGLTINMRATSLGGTGTATQISRTVDAAAPTTTHNAPAGWQAADVTVTLTPNDGTGSGVASTQYCVDSTNSCVPGTAGTTVNVTQTAGTAGTQYVRFRSTDNLANAEAVKSASVQIDKSLPIDGTLSTSPSNGQVGLSWTVASDTGSGLRAANTYDLRFLAGATPPTCATGTSIYTGTATSTTHTGLTNGTQYSYRLCAYDNVNNASVGATASATPSAVCSSADPTVTILAPNKQITSAGGSAVYTVEVTNNDSVDCGSTTFSLSRSDSDATSFLTSVLGSSSLPVAPGATGSTTLTVASTGSPINGAINNTTVSTAAAGPHGAVTSPAITTLINLTRTATMYYNIGETVHFEYRSSTRFISQGAGALSIYSSTGSIIQSNLNMLETQVGAAWVYTYDWNTAAQPADTYRVKIWDASDTTPAANGMIVLGNSTKKLNLFADAGYTTPTDIFAQGATVYAEVILPLPETATVQTDISNWYNGAPTLPALTVTETGSRYRFHFAIDFAGASIADGDWGWFYWLGQDTGIEFHRPIQRNDAGCGSCARSTPTVAMVTADQTITSDGGSVDYTINVTNNDTVACGPTSFDLIASDSNLSNFNASTFGADPLAVGPGLTGSTVLTVSAKVGQPNGSTNATTFYTAADGNHAASVNSATRTTTLSVADVTAPVVTAFDVPATSTSWTIPVITFTATDAIGVTGYLVTESAIAPLAGDAGWVASAPLSYLTASDGTKTLYAWARDAAGNVSASLSDTITVDATAPVVTDFTMSAVSTSLTVPITQFLATDAIGVTGYRVTTSSTPPPAGDPGWTASAPASYTVGASATYTFYPWAKDALGNVSAVFGTPQTVNVDTVAPSVASTVPAGAATGVTLDSSVTINFSEPVDCGTVNATNIVSDSPGWAYDGTSCTASGGTQAVFTTSGQAFSTIYNVSVTSAVRDLVGNPLSPAPYNFAFTTESEACVYGTPTVSIDTPNQNAVVDGDLVNYTVTIINTDTGACGNTIFSLVAVDSNSTDFDPSSFDAATISLAPSSSGARNLRVKAKAGALNGASNDTYFYTAADGNHAQSLNSGVATTVIAVPCDVAPDVAITTGNQSITTDGGSAAYTLQVTNNNALACGATAFDLVAVDDNGVAFSIPSVFATDPLTVNPGGGSNTTTLSVTSLAGAANFSVNNSYFYTALAGTIPKSANSNAVATTINRPCLRNAPSFSAGVNKTIPLDGTAIYNLTIINNDVDCTDTTFNLALNSETGNTTAFTLPSTLSAASVVVAPGMTNSTVTLTVQANGSGVEGNTLTSTVQLSDTVNHVGLNQTTAPVTTVMNFSPLIHNSNSTASTKHQTQGGWGVPGGKYGEFTCATCHVPTTTNIKRIVTTLPSASDTGKGNFPGAGQPVVLQDVRDGSAQFGDDTAAHATSNRICEVCHTYDPTDPRDDGVKQHAYNMPVAATHYNNTDCINCHKHSSGFDASGGSCDSCHGYPPDAADGKGNLSTEGKGAHLKHVNHLAARAGITLDPNGDSFGDVNTILVCGVCHDMNSASHEMGGGTRNINFNGSSTFQFGNNAPIYNGVQGKSSGSPDFTPKTCSNINCHFQSTPWWE